MKKNTYLFSNKKSFTATLIVFSTIVFSQDLKKEIQIPFPENITIEDPMDRNIRKDKPAIPTKEEEKKQSIRIPFPKDPVDKRESEVEFKQIEVTETKPELNNPITNSNFPLEKIIVVPETESAKNAPVIESNPKTLNLEKPAKSVSNATELPSSNVSKDTKPNIEPVKPIEKENIKPTTDIGKALLESEKSKSVAKPKSTEVNNLPKSKLDLGEYGAKDKSPKSTEKTASQAKEAKEIKEPSAKKAETTGNLQTTNLPNVNKTSDKKGKDKKKADESSAPFERSRYYLNREDKTSAVSELNIASSGEGEKSNLAKMDQIRLLAQERKKNEAKSIIESISDQDYKFKGLYELAVGLENSAKGDRKLKEEAIPFHLTIITEAPESNSIVPKSLWALSHLLFTIGDHTPALDHLSDIILKHSKSEYIDDAIYLSGRIYEESTTIRNLNRAKK